MSKRAVIALFAAGVAALVLVVGYSAIDPALLHGFFTTSGERETSASSLDRYAAKPAGHESPAQACVVCHNLEKGAVRRVAPNLWAIVGAPKAGEAGYGYSKALFEAGGVWTEQELKDYLADPDGFLPGTKKTITGIRNPEELNEIIAYLKTLHD